MPENNILTKGEMNSEGATELWAHGDRNRNFRVNLADENILVRHRKAYKQLDKSVKELTRIKLKAKDDYDSLIDAIEIFDADARTCVNDIFLCDVCTPVFGSVSLTAPVNKNGDMYLMVFLDEIGAMIQDAKNEHYARVEAEVKALKEKTAKYTEGYDDEPISGEELERGDEA